jgi:hypothetical protein
MRARIKVLIFAVLVLAPVLLRWAWFHRGAYTPPQIAELDEAEMEVSLPEYRSSADEAAEAAGRVVIDVGHENNLEVDDLTPLRDRLVARGAVVEEYDGYTTTLASQLRGAVALVVAAPTFQFADWEVDAVVDFVEKGGRVLLAADPTRPVAPPGEEYDVDLYDVLYPQSAVPAVNSLADSLGVVYFDDYLYNLVDYEGNYRNVSFGLEESDPALTEGVNSVILFAAHSLRSEGEVLLAGDANTQSSLRTGESDLAAGVLSAQGCTLALGDLTFLTAPYHTMGDNDRFLSNVADWLLGAEREWDLRDFPYLFQRPVDLVQVSGEYLDPRLFTSSDWLSDVMDLAGLTLTLADAADPDHDAIFVGTFDNVELVQDYLDEVGVTITILEEGTPTPTPATEEEEEVRDNVEVEGLGALPLEGTSLFVVSRETDRVVVTVLAEDGDATMAALDRLASADFSYCVDHEDVMVCSTGEGEEGLGLDEEPQPVATPRPVGTPAAGPRIGSVAESEAAMGEFVPWLQELAEESYDETSEAGETYIYTVYMDTSQDVLWVYGWCARSDELLQQNWENISLVFTLGVDEVPLSRFAVTEVGTGTDECRLYCALLTDWPDGEYVLTTEVTFETEIDDGTDVYPAGTHYELYLVSVGAG